MGCPVRGCGYRDAAGEKMQLVLEATGQLPVLDVEILRVADDRMPNMGRMRPQLVCAPRDRLERKPG
jgi:hypothetical protein